MRGTLAFAVVAGSGAFAAAPDNPYEFLQGIRGSYERQFFKRYLLKTGKKVDNQLKMIQKGLLLSGSYSRSVKLLPEATHDKCPSRCLNLSVNLFNDTGDIRFAPLPEIIKTGQKAIPSKHLLC